MSLPPLVKESERDQKEWNRKARDAINRLTRFALGTGATTERPQGPTDGQVFYDRTLKQPIWWNSEDAEWKDATGTAA
ncbi:MULTISPECIES: hypothetical protein [unclassified Sphingomonas]|uniref:hypothetical protein n=1 Tax=unclassified Sphingomonas TaxID=196159 RepID=UPI0006F46274|nr:MULTISPECIES: hypothetical protein [unclassified Sphingomonas]KQX18144.1 hypothetical protein ASD17_20955 [Sphingomonas sp. Root1294]KQY72699.1 hypothetical protein ASD39_18070 [Sphingomonas sp. Root50]KRB87675.1 hypothetical protein ASE22_23505 [Sphingomonas sp. Root720]